MFFFLVRPKVITLSGLHCIRHGQTAARKPYAVLQIIFAALGPFGCFGKNKIQKEHEIFFEVTILASTKITSIFFCNAEIMNKLRNVAIRENLFVNFARKQKKLGHPWAIYQKTASI